MKRQNELTESLPYSPLARETTGLGVKGLGVKSRMAGSVLAWLLGTIDLGEKVSGVMSLGCVLSGG